MKGSKLMKLVLIALLLITFAIIDLYFMIAEERRKTKEDITDVKYEFIKELIKQNEKVNYETSKKR